MNLSLKSDSLHQIMVLVLSFALCRLMVRKKGLIKLEEAKPNALLDKAWVAEK